MIHTTNFDHIFVTGGGLQGLKNRLGRVALDILTIDDNLNNAIPDLKKIYVNN